MMRRQSRHRILFFIVAWMMLIPAHAAAGPPAVIYKEARPLKMIFAAKTPPSEQELLSDLEKELAYAYDPTGKTDPFKSFIADQEEVAEQQKRKPKTYLETLDLSQLELIAIITGSKGNYAMVRDSKGLGHVIRKGTAIGTNGGTVHAISAEKVTVREEFRDFRGRIKHKEVAKKLPSLH
jgi:type IV pilus assembly protein PilP